MKELFLLFLVSLLVRLGGAWLLGQGAPFGPDGTGAEAAVVLGNHMYPLHIAALKVVGSAQALSLVCGSLSCVCLAFVARHARLGTAAGWIAAFLPVAVYPSVLAGGDAPAQLVVLAGVALATQGRIWAVLGGALALCSVAVKPIALPLTVLLILHPWSLLGVALTLPWAAAWLRPLFSPMQNGGLLGSWWPATQGQLPDQLSELLSCLVGGFDALLQAPGWAGAGLLILGLLGSLRPRASTRPPDPLQRLAFLGPIGATLAVCAAFGDSLQPRYLAAPLLACLPWAGAALPTNLPRLGTAFVPLLASLLLWPSLALLTQLGATRAEADPAAQVPEVPILAVPVVDTAPLFYECSTPDATLLRARAHELAKTLPEGATVQVERRPHGREGELVWPLMVLRPDVQIQFGSP